ncbi:MAG: mechanosensitive ion channel [Crocinitomicaceae bacterium]|nr:mechanosensitive ion channel [Crocinitomicaceae bacterium]
MVLNILHKRFKVVGDIYVDVDKTIFALLIILGTWLFIVALRRLITRPNFIADKIQEKRQMTIFLLTKYAAWFVAILSSLSVLGIDLTTLVLGSTALLVGLGFGLQHIFRDFISGIFLLFEGSIKIGDIIEVDDVVGVVLEVNLRSCELKTRDDVKIIVPNSKFLAEEVVNWSHESDQVRFTIELGVAYGSDIDKVNECLVKAMQAHKHVSSSPKPYIHFSKFGESSLEFKMFFWSKNTFLIEQVKSDIRMDLYKRLKENGLEIPFPQRDVHIKGMDNSELLAKGDLKKGLEN